VNAAEQANSFEMAGKIATLVNRFKSRFPDAKADLRPWANDQATRNLIDPDSIDIGFHFPGRSRRLQSRSLLFQIRFYKDGLVGSNRAIGVEVAGFDHRGEQWRLSTVGNWAFSGSACPETDLKNELKQFLQEVFEVFNGDSDESESA